MPSNSDIEQATGKVTETVTSPLAKKNSSRNNQDNPPPPPPSEHAAPSDDSGLWRRVGLAGAILVPMAIVVILAIFLSVDDFNGRNNGDTGSPPASISAPSTGTESSTNTSSIGINVTEQETLLREELLDLQQQYFGKRFILGKSCQAGSILGVTRVLSRDDTSHSSVNYTLRVIVPFGQATLDEDDNPAHPITEDTLFEIGSVSKPLTGLILADMIVSGMFGDRGLETPLNDLLPAEVPELKLLGQEDLVTLRNLVTHTAGLPRLSATLLASSPEWNVYEDNPYAGYTEQQLIDDLAVAATDNVARTPPDTFEYSNFGFSILGYILSRTSGIPFAELQKSVTDRMGMNNTWIVPNATSLPTNVQETLLSSGYVQGRRMPHWFGGGLFINGAGSTLSSAKDLARWMELLMDSNDDEIDPQLRDALQLSLTPVKEGPLETSDSDSGDSGIAYAWFYGNHDSGVSTNNTNIVYSHTGGTAGYASYVTFQPSTRTAVIGMTNCAHMAEDLIEMVNVKVSQLFANVTDTIF